MTDSCILELTMILNINQEAEANQQEKAANQMSV